VEMSLTNNISELELRTQATLDEHLPFTTRLCTRHKKIIGTQSLVLVH